MKERCEDCRGLEEDIYWTHFQTMHFFHFLSGDFHSQLMIPERFAEKVGWKLGQKLGLRGPSGTTWDVQLVQSGDVLCFGGGWEVFVDDHSLVEKDTLVFKYTGNSQFDVLIFDGGSLCEKENSYFVRKCGHTMPEDRTETPSTIFKECCSEEIIQEHSPDDFVSIDPIENAGKGTVVADCEIAGASKDKEKGLKKACSDQPEFACAKYELRGQNPSQIWETVKLPGSKKMPRREANSTTDQLCNAANRTPMSEARNVAALKSAYEQLSENSFLLSMRSTHVRNKFVLNLPQEWVKKHVTPEKQDVILRRNERSWRTTMVFTSKGRGALCRGWRIFAVNNRLEELDVCVFKLTSQKQKPVVLDVTIFRATPEVAPPLTWVTPEPSSSRGASALSKRKFSQLENDA